jgi:hypothetical protein
VRTLIVAVVVATLVLLAVAFTTDEPTATECCIDPRDPSTCDAYVWEFKDGIFVRRLICPISQTP